MISKEDWDEFVEFDKKAYALEIISDIVADYLYYNRKEDEDLNRDDMEQLITSGQLTADEIIERFDKYLREALNEY